MSTIHIEIDSVPSKLVLATTCWKCAGAGTPMDKCWANDAGTCDGCNGTGNIITDAGKAIFALLKLNINTKGGWL